MDGLPQIIRDLVRIGATQRFGEINRLLSSREKRAEIHMKPESFWLALADRLSPREIGSLLTALSVEERALTGWSSGWRSPVAFLSNRLRAMNEWESFNTANLAIAYRLKKHGIGCLYYMTHIDNLLSICVRGILSYTRAQTMPHTTLSDWHIQKRRRALHDYVPLYFATHTPMQHCIRNKFVPPIQSEKLVFIELDALKIFQLKNVLFTDGNAAASITAIYEDLTDLKKLDLTIIQRITRCYSPRYKRLKAAEVLVKDRIDSDCFLKVVFFSGESKRKFIALNVGRPSNHRLEVDPTLY